MEKMFGSRMKDFFSGIADDDSQELKLRLEKMAAMCPCINMRAMSDEDKSKMVERMKSCCGDMMAKMSAACK